MLEIAVKGIADIDFVSTRLRVRQIRPKELDKQCSLQKKMSAFKKKRFGPQT